MLVVLKDLGEAEREYCGFVDIFSHLVSCLDISARDETYKYFVLTQMFSHTPEAAAGRGEGDKATNTLY